MLFKIYGKGYSNTLTALRYACDDVSRCATSYRIARATGLSPQHTNTLLKRAFDRGVVAYRVVQHRKGQNKREWTTVKLAMKNPTQWIIPEYIQQEMEI